MGTNPSIPSQLLRNRANNNVRILTTWLILTSTADRSNPAYHSIQIFWVFQRKYTYHNKKGKLLLTNLCFSCLWLQELSYTKNVLLYLLNSGHPYLKWMDFHIWFCSKPAFTYCTEWQHKEFLANTTDYKTNLLQ